VLVFAKHVTSNSLEYILPHDAFVTSVLFICP